MKGTVEALDPDGTRVDGGPPSGRELLDKRESSSKPDRGIVHIETRAYNQDRERILVLRRYYLAPKRGTS